MCAVRGWTRILLFVYIARRSDGGWHVYIARRSVYVYGQISIRVNGPRPPPSLTYVSPRLFYCIRLHSTEFNSIQTEEPQSQTNRKKEANKRASVSPWSSCLIPPPFSSLRSHRLQPMRLWCLTRASRDSPLFYGSTVLVPAPSPLFSLSSFHLFNLFLWAFCGACLFRAAQLRLCADGGANRVYDDMPLLLPHENAFDVRKRFLFFYFLL